MLYKRKPLSSIDRVVYVSCFSSAFSPSFPSLYLFLLIAPCPFALCHWLESLIAMSAPVDDNGHPSLAFLRKNSAARRERMEKGLSRASSQATTTTSSSSNTSSSARYYPSDSSNMTTASIEHYLASAPLPPPPPSSSSSSATPGHQQILTDDHFDIIDSLNYDDIDDGMFGMVSCTCTTCNSTHAKIYTHWQNEKWIIDDEKHLYNNWSLQNALILNHFEWYSKCLLNLYKRMPSNPPSISLEWRSLCALNERLDGYLATLMRLYKFIKRFLLVLKSGKF